jgi:predicted DNA-binding transcriptional regulator AlpA
MSATEAFFVKRSPQQWIAPTSSRRCRGHLEKGGDHVDDIWVPKEVANHLRISVHTLYQWRGRNYGPPARKMGKHLRYLRQDVIDWVGQQSAEVN